MGERAFIESSKKKYFDQKFIELPALVGWEVARGLAKHPVNKEGEKERGA